MKFSSLTISENLLRAVLDMGFKDMTPIQADSIPSLLEGKDLIGQSQTGSGKTAAFLIPILQKIQSNESYPQAIILCPTRELCDQVLRESRKFSKVIPGLQTVALVGGQPYSPQKQALDSGAQLIIGTPGRTLEHLRDGNLKVEKLKTFVLDEADRMLEEGFQEEMSAILEQLPEKRQTVFFSATFPESIELMSQKYQKNAVRVTIHSENKNTLKIEQYLYESENPQKIETMIKILKNHPSMCTLIFCRTKATVDEVGTLLKQKKVSCTVLHGDLEQNERDRATSLFRNGSLRILVATDVAARGLDIETLDLVINLDLPSTPEVYVHRIGRTGRAGRTGVAVSIATAYETEKVHEIEQLTGVVMMRKIASSAVDLELGQEFQKTLMKTLQIAAGKNDKMRPGDILGALTAKPQEIAAVDIGKIEIHTRYSYVAVKPSAAHKALAKLRDAKIKGKKIKSYLV